MAANFYVVVFKSRDTGSVECSRTFSTIRMARKWAKFYAGIADDARILKGGIGGEEVM